MTTCSHGLSLTVDCKDCADVIAHLKECNECAVLMDYKQPFRYGVEQ